jgi:hypothetical protein
VKATSAIVGLGLTEMGKVYGRSRTDFAAEAIAAAGWRHACGLRRQTELITPPPSSPTHRAKPMPLAAPVTTTTLVGEFVHLN